jgi:ubiquinone/menaquinone biosynthesis C-methylase UbiE
MQSGMWFEPLRGFSYDGLQLDMVSVEDCAAGFVLEKLDYDDRQYAVYARGRAVSPESIAVWMQAFARYLADDRPLTILDLGSGTGRFTPALANEFGGPVYGVEPSRRMREVAAKSSHHPAVTYLAGSAENIPLPDSSCDAILMFLSFHHVQDGDAAAPEIARILRPEGRILIRSAFSDRMPKVHWHRFFPRARAIEREMFPSLGEVEVLFSTVGLRRIALETIREQFASSLAESASRLRLRAISTFDHMTDAELAEGFAALDRAVAAETTPRPVSGLSDLLVLGPKAA